MNKKQKVFKTSFPFFSILLLVVLLCFVLLSPKISSQLFPNKQKVTLDKFIDLAKAEGHIDPQEYWKFREFYSPGYFTFSKKGFNNLEIEKIDNNVNKMINTNPINFPFLLFDSPSLKSIDMLTTSDNLEGIIKLDIKNEDIIFKNNTSLMYQENSSTIKAILLFNYSEMRKANGFFDYDDEDKEITLDKNWLSIATIKTR